jgi:hypothetical protein
MEMFSPRHWLFELDKALAPIPVFLQIVVSLYLAIVLGNFALGRIQERRGMLVAVLALVIAGLLGARGATMLYAMLF